MRKIILALTVVLSAPTAALASAHRGELVGGPESGAAAVAIPKIQILPAGGVTLGQQGVSVDTIVLAKGDMSGSGPGTGGQKGQKKGGHKGKHAEGKDNPSKGKDKNKP